VDALQKVGLWPALRALVGDYSGGRGLRAGGTSFDEDQERHLLSPPPLFPPEEEESKKVLNLKLGSEGGIGLSQGQQQMVCLARVVLISHTLKILCLDEASASVDPGTAEALHQVVKTCFKGCTVIEVAHRLRSVAECDVIFVMNKGHVVESGAPKTLAEDSKSVFAGMLREQADKAGCTLM
jgi:hypothetical protein